MVGLGFLEPTPTHFTSIYALNQDDARPRAYISGQHSSNTPWPLAANRLKSKHMLVVSALTPLLSYLCLTNSNLSNR